MNELDDVRPHEDPITLFQARLRDLLPVDERTVRTAKVFDEDLTAVRRDTRVAARHHVLDQDHVELARSPDDDLRVHLQGELAALVLP